MTEAHSPLGASGAERWMVCPGSVGLSDGVPREDDDEFSAPGTAAHALAAWCLGHNYDAWEHIGNGVGIVTGHIYYREEDTIPEGVSTIVVDKEMADAVQLYLDAIRTAHPDRDQGNSFIERRFHCPDIHKEMYGTSDFTYIDQVNYDLHVWDYKHGAGIVVDVKENVQLMYYACGMLTDLNLWGTIEKVVLHIAQPRGFHWGGPIREWSISADALERWMDNVLVPAMDRAQTSDATQSGEHCRFCPVRGRKCPQIMEDLAELDEIVAKSQAKSLTAAENGRILTLMVVAMIARKQALKHATAQLNAGHAVPGWKLAKARANRKFKDGAQAKAITKFGNQAFTMPELKSPAQIDALPEGKAFTTRWAYKPDTGETVVPEGDSRMEVSRDTKAGFKPVKKGKK